MLLRSGTGDDNDESILDQVKRIEASHKTGGEDGGGSTENRQQHSGDGTVQQECMDTGTSSMVLVTLPTQNMKMAWITL
jgi:hypothetical protein